MIKKTSLNTTELNKPFFPWCCCWNCNAASLFEIRNKTKQNSQVYNKKKLRSLIYEQNKKTKTVSNLVGVLLSDVLH